MMIALRRILPVVALHRTLPTAIGWRTPSSVLVLPQRVKQHVRLWHSRSDDDKDAPDNNNNATTTTTTSPKDDKSLEHAKHELEHRATEKGMFAVSKRTLEQLEKAARAGQKVMERSGEKAAFRVGEKSALQSGERGLNRVGQNAAKHVVGERTAERLAERLGDRVSERGAQRAVGRATTGSGERLLERASESAVARMGHRSSERTASAMAANLERWLGVSVKKVAIRIGRGLTIALPVLGGVFAFYLFISDYKRWKEEKKMSRFSMPLVLFYGAGAADLMDAVLHFYIAYALLANLGHDALLVPEHLSVGCAVLSTVFAVLGEILSHRRLQKSKKVVQ
jgi:hypothetical protein